MGCEHSQYGCSWNDRRQELAAHMRGCPYESLKGFFTMHASRMTSLEAENAALRNQVERLQMTQDVLRKDLQSARCSLGPWFRPADSQPPLAPAAHARPERLVQRHRMSVPLSSASFGHPLDFMEGADSGIHVHSTTTIHDPSSSPESDWPTESTSGFVITQHEPHHTSPPDMAHPRMSSYSHAQTWVAPIDLTTSLEGCLTSLRSSIVNLATALDSQERRQDIALATETLRMHEEVASLRAIVQGLRMQVHSGSLISKEWSDPEVYLPLLRCTQS